MEEILENILNRVCEIIQTGLTSFLKILIVNSAQSSFTPSLDYLTENVLGGGEIGIAYLEKLKSLFFMVGGSVLIAMLFIHFIGLFLSGFHEAKDTIVGLFGRTVFCIVMMFLIYTFGDAVMDFGNSMLAKASEYSLADEITEDDLSVYTDGDDSKETIYDDLDTVITANDSENLSGQDEYMGLNIKEAALSYAQSAKLWVVIAIIRIILFCIVIYSFIKLVLEQIQRYMMAMVMYIGLPTAVALFGSAETELCFFAYMKMYGVEVAILVLTSVWIDISMYIMGHTISSFIGMLVMISFLRIGVSVERFLKEIGLSTASLGGSLLDTTAITGFAMLRAVSMGKEAIGKGTANVAALSGNMKLGQAASSILGRGSSLSSASQVMNSTVGARISESMKHPGAQGALAKAFSSGGLNGNRDAVSIMSNPSLSSSQKMKLGNQALSSQYVGAQGAIGKGNKLTATGEYNFQRGLGVTMTDQNGNVRTGYLSATSGPGRGMSIGFQDADGRQCYLNLNNDQTDKFKNCYNEDGEVLTNGKLCTADIAAGITDKDQAISAHTINGDMDAAHYMYSETKNDGTRDLLYRDDDFSDWERKGFLAEDGILYTDGSRDFGDHMITMSDYDGKNLEIHDKYGLEIELDDMSINQGDLARMEVQAAFADKGERLQCELHDEKGNPTGEHAFFTTKDQGEYFNAGYDAKSMTNIHFSEDGTISATVFKRDGTGTNSDGLQEQTGIHMSKTTATGLIKNAKHVNGRMYGSRTILEDRKMKGNVQKSAF